MKGYRYLYIWYSLIRESKNIKYTGSDTLSCKTSLNKIESKKIWRDLLLPTPDFVEIVNVGKPEMKLTPHLSGENDITALDKTYVVKLYYISLI